jgi:tetraacyldisaccharide 4'-kinase
MDAVAPSLEPSPSLPPDHYFHALVSGRTRGPWAGLQRGGLRLAAIPFGWATRLRNALFDRGWKRVYRAAVAVVSVGNLTLGGTGKTPCVEYVACYYLDQGLRVAVLSRGYGAAAGCNDEALVLEENLPDVPHLQGADRVALAQTAVTELESEVLVLDDGFQHRRLARDLDVVMVDATNPWGHGYQFPRGLLRESPAGLRRAQVVLLTRCDQVPGEQRDQLRATISRLAPHAVVAESVHQPLELQDGDGTCRQLDLLRDRPVAAFCGLGNPAAFRRTLLDLGANVRTFRTFPDHHPYSRTDVEALRFWARQLASDAVVVTTQKDLVKLRLSQLGGRALYALRIRLHVTKGQESLDQQLLSVVRYP